MEELWVGILGTTGTILSTVSLTPQVVRTWRTRSAIDISAMWLDLRDGIDADLDGLWRLDRCAGRHFGRRPVFHSMWLHSFREVAEPGRAVGERG